MRCHRLYTAVRFGLYGQHLCSCRNMSQCRRVCTICRFVPMWRHRLSNNTGSVLSPTTKHLHTWMLLWQMGQQFSMYTVHHSWLLLSKWWHAGRNTIPMPSWSILTGVGHRRRFTVSKLRTRSLLVRRSTSFAMHRLLFTRQIFL